MSDHYEKCGCEESIILRLAIREYVENNDDTRIRREYGGTLPPVVSPETPEQHNALINETLARTVQEAIYRLDKTISESKKTMSYAKDAYEKALFELGVAERDRAALIEVLNPQPKEG